MLVYIDTPFEELASRLIDRHVSFGRDRADAAHWVRTVDAANMALVERTKARADLVLSLYCNAQFPWGRATTPHNPHDLNDLV